ncbi:MAG: hypothetical protein ACXABU_12525, partial [Candidatus Hodarchaeales archaeon]
MSKVKIISFLCFFLGLILVFPLLANDSIINNTKWTLNSQKVLDKSELVSNGGFEQNFTDWNFVGWPFPGEAHINISDSYEGEKSIVLIAPNSQNRIGYRQKVNRSDLTDFSFSFSIKHDNGSLYQAGLAVYYHDYADTYLGRTYWSVSNEIQDNNDSENSILLIRTQSYPEWHTVTVNLSSPGIKPPNVSNLSIVKYFEIYLHVYGVSGYGTSISIWYDDISMVDSRIVPPTSES